MPPAKRVETSVDASCPKHGVIYRETRVEEHGKPVEVRVSGSFLQALDASSEPVGPVIPFCPICKES